ncbi:MAG TPA: serine hydroxymethyltransferase [Limnochordia bacterium]
MRRPALAASDPDVFAILESEIERQNDGLELIPSENYVSPAVLEALGSEMTNKYSEGYPGRRYYGGQENTDALESLAIERAKRLFHADHANVQALSGAAANLAVYHAWLEPGDTVLAMELSHGGHLTHGAPVTLAARYYRFIRYGMKDVHTGEIDYDALEETAERERPRLILAGFSSYPRTLDYRRIAAVANKVGAVAMADMSHIAGLIAGGQLENPLDCGFHVMTTTTHKTLRGPRGALILSKGRVLSPLRAPEKTIENLPTLIDRSVFPGLQGGPHMNAVLAIAVALREASTPAFQAYARQVLINARALADALIARGCSLITGGTDNHLMLIDTIKSFGKDGNEVQQILDRVHITLNKNAIPDDPLPPFRASGVRLGTPAATTRGFDTDDMERIAEWIVSAVRAADDEARLSAIRDEVTALCRAKPIPTWSAARG